VPAERYILPVLPYDYDGLEPYITRDMVVAHYEGHHESYRVKMNAALNEWREDEPLNKLTTQPLAKILANLDSVPEKFSSRLQNNIGGFANHAIFWSVMNTNVNGTERLPTDRLLSDIESSFVSFDEFKNKFTAAALDLFGSGYVWLVRDRSAPTGMQLSIVTTVNQDSPLSRGVHPILVIDVWEHAYYLKYQFRRNEFVDDWWKLIEWKQVAMLDRFWKKVIDMDYVDHDEL